ncbi:MAG TPA: hypothetical protein VHA52_06380 [Candidatus Babeliaceae bacterium]|nr:hypothetical protein [Candidatus Babeliaceae bacterium]
MFSNFVTFTEVVKLSSIIKHRLETIQSPGEDIIKEIVNKKDTESALNLMDIIEDRSLLVRFAPLLRLNRNVDQIYRKIIDEPNLDIYAIKNELFVYCCDKGYLKMARKLLSIGADINTRGYYAIYQSVANKNITVLRFLKENGAKIDSGVFNYFKEGYDKRNRGIIKYLVENFDNIDISNTDYPVLEIIISSGDIKTTKYIIGKYPHLLKTERSFLVDYAVESGNLEILKFFENFGLDYKKIDYYPFATAVESDQMEALKFLTQRNSICCNIKCAFQRAVIKNKLNCAKYLSTLSVFSFSNLEGEILYEVEEAGYTEMYKWLVENGANERLKEEYRKKKELEKKYGYYDDLAARINFIFLDKLREA